MEDNAKRAFDTEKKAKKEDPLVFWSAASVLADVGKKQHADDLKKVHNAINEMRESGRTHTSGILALSSPTTYDFIVKELRRSGYNVYEEVNGNALQEEREGTALHPLVEGG